MTKLSIPVICECGFSTMDAKKAYDHAMLHIKKKKEPTGELGDLPDILSYKSTGIEPEH